MAALRRGISPSMPIPVPSMGSPLKRNHQLVSCSLESTLSMSQVPMLALPRHWIDSDHSSAPFPHDLSLLSGPPECLDDEMPPVEPPYICKTWALRSAASPDAIMNALRVALEQHGIDAERGADRWRIDGASYIGECSSRFSIFVFKSDEDAAFTIEVQRRAGDPFAFRDFFNLLLESLRDLISASPVCSRAISCATLPPFGRSSSNLSETDTIEMSSGTLKCLMSMASSECIDVRREALQSLTRVCHSEQCQNALVTSSLALPVLRRALLASDLEIVRCAISIIATLCTTEAGRSAALRASLLEPVVSLLQSPVSHIARHAASTIARVSQTHSCRLQLSRRHARMLRRCRDAADDRVRELVSGAVERMERYGSLTATSPSRSLIFEGHAPLSV